MKVETFRIDEFTSKELKKILKRIKITKSNFIRICIIEKLQRINEGIIYEEDKRDR